MLKKKSQQGRRQQSSVFRNTGEEKELLPLLPVFLSARELHYPALGKSLNQGHMDFSAVAGVGETPAVVTQV